MAGKDFRFGIDGSAQGLDLNRLLVAHPSSTFFMRLESDAKHLELHAGDILQIDRSLTPQANSLAVVFEEDDPEMKVVRWGSHQKKQQLWGVIAYVIRDVQP